jgi:hypothetical protein
MVRRQPAVEQLDDLDPAVTDDYRTRRLLAAMAGIAFDLYHDYLRSVYPVGLTQAASLDAARRQV